jgi:hypothetical protein
MKTVMQYAHIIGHNLALFEKKQYWWCKKQKIPYLTFKWKIIFYCCHTYVKVVQNCSSLAQFRDYNMGWNWPIMLWFQVSLTLCRRATQKCVIALPCVVDGSRISAFSYTSSCTCVWHLIWLTYRLKFIVSLMQDVGSQVIFKRPRNWGYLIKRPSGWQSVKRFFYPPKHPNKLQGQPTQLLIQWVLEALCWGYSGYGTKLPLTSIQCRGYDAQRYTTTLPCLHSLVLHKVHRQLQPFSSCANEIYIYTFSVCLYGFL